VIRGGGGPPSSLSSSNTFLSSHFLYGNRLATSRLSSASSTIRPSEVSTTNIMPGWSRPLARTRSGGTSITPVSDARITRSSEVIVQRAGRRPLRSSVAPTSWPSLNTIAAGPSHGSTSDDA
jgi:hypothetical protein